MKTSHKLILLVTVAFVFGFAIGSNDYKIKRKDVAAAQRLIGIDFNKAEIDTVLNYLNENLAGYDTMRVYLDNLDNDIAPALYFDPLPNGFVVNTNQETISWNIPDGVSLPDDMDDLAFYTVPQLASLIKSKKISSKELTQYYIDRIKKYDSQLLSVITLTEELAMKQAQQADEELASGQYRGPLHGIPYGIKDLFAVEGYKTTWGARPYQDQTLDYNATIVTKLEQAGAVLIAKLTSGALARGDVWFGGQTKNPWDLNEGASGSSAGSGSATSAGLVGFSIGTETLGSITYPSTVNGITGLRPTYGRVSRFGCMPLSWTMDKPGPMCRSALGCAMVLDVIRGVDNKDRTVVDASFNFQPTPLADMKIGYLNEPFASDSSDNAINNEAALEVFRSLGAELQPVTFPEDLPFEALDLILWSEAGAFFDELVRSGDVSTMVQQHQRSRANSLRQSRFIPAVEYVQANRHRAVLIEKLHEVMKDLDVLIVPTFYGRQLLSTNLSGHPAIAIPTGLDEEDHPTSITLLGNLYDEAAILAAAQKFQEGSTFDELHPPDF